jgi:hypothetical protein
MLYVFFLVWPWNPQTRFAKKHFSNIEPFYLKYLTFYPSKKVPASPIRIEKKILQNILHRVSKFSIFFTDLKYVQKS